MGQQSQNKAKKDDEYRDAIQPVVDEAMEAHNLAPAIKTAINENKPLNDSLQNIFKNAIKDNKPLNDELQNIVIKTICNNKDAQAALDEVVANNKAIKDSKKPTKSPIFWITISINIIGILTNIFIAIFTH